MLTAPNYVPVYNIFDLYILHYDLNSEYSQEAYSIILFAYNIL